MGNKTIKEFAIPILGVANRETDIAKIKVLSVKGKDLLKQIIDLAAIRDDLATFEQIVSDEH